MNLLPALTMNLLRQIFSGDKIFLRDYKLSCRSMIGLPLLIFFASITLGKSQTSAAENAVDITFRDVSKSEWHAEKSAKFTKELISRVQNKCQLDPEVCGVTNSKLDPDVSTSVISEERGLLKLSVNAQSQKNGTFINKNILKDILLSSRSILSKVTGLNIDSIDDTSFPLPPNWNLNAIIIPIAVGLIGLLSFVTIFYACHQRRLEKEILAEELNSSSAQEDDNKRAPAKLETQPIHRRLEIGNLPSQAIVHNNSAYESDAYAAARETNKVVMNSSNLGSMQFSNINKVQLEIDPQLNYEANVPASRNLSAKSAKSNRMAEFTDEKRRDCLTEMTYPDSVSGRSAELEINTISESVSKL